MLLLFKILIIIAIVLVSLFLFGLYLLFAMFSAFNDGPGYDKDYTLKDILPIQPTSAGDIPIFVELLREARESKNISLCESLPEPQVQNFDFGDYSDSSPNRLSWLHYCQALITEDPSMCPKNSGHPNLGQECHYVLEQILIQKTNSTQIDSFKLD